MYAHMYTYSQLSGCVILSFLCGTSFDVTSSDANMWASPDTESEIYFMIDGT